MTFHLFNNSCTVQWGRKGSKYLRAGTASGTVQSSFMKSKHRHHFSQAKSQEHKSKFLLAFLFGTKGELGPSDRNVISLPQLQQHPKAEPFLLHSSLVFSNYAGKRKTRTQIEEKSLRRTDGRMSNRIRGWTEKSSCKIRPAATETPQEKFKKGTSMSSEICFAQKTTLSI